MLYAFDYPELADLYLSGYTHKAGKGKEDVLQWLPVVAAARLDEGNEGEKDQIMGWIQNI
ncbi:MAG: hypothetical protein P4L75_01435 [Clostridia bacterium]|nr:hypothetical protein [Clostridia bacterium]MDR3643582.1 hypothetical protein [Clostridia bacterium]